MGPASLRPAAAAAPHWWQWPTIGSLDAPAVALAWQALLAHATGVERTGAAAFVLGASVWLAYAADRWFEGWRLAPGQILTPRHRFYHRWRWPVAVAWMLVLLLDVGVAVVQLPRRDLLAGMVLLVPVLGYLLSHQLVHRHHRWRVPKEICVATLLAGGVAVFLGAHPEVRAGTLGGLLAPFALLCFANCALISAWEQRIDLVHGQTSLARQYQQGARVARALPWLLALVFLLWAPAAGEPFRLVLGCALASSVLLGLVDRFEPRLGWQLARVLADAALLTPVWPLLTHRFAGPG
jgi:hypothetical protein